VTQGIEQGRESERLNLIVNAYRNGTPTNIIGSFVNLSEEEIIEILRNVKDL
jgi:hypothetical protein